MEKAFGLRPCLWQIKVTEAILKRDRDVVSIAGMGMGKTLTFWMPLLFRPKNSVQIIVTPLNLLGMQNVQALKKAGYKAILICADMATHENFQVCLYFLSIQCSQISYQSQAIVNLEYQGVIITPEKLMKLGGGFEHLIKNVHFTSHITSVIFDEAHCISTWGSFCSEYKEISHLHYMLPVEIPIMITTATLPPLIFDDIKNTLRLRPEKLTVIRRSSDCPNINIVVRPIQHLLNSFADLKFLLHDWKVGGSPPPKFLIFFNNINEAVRACQYFHSLVPVEYQDKFIWFNSDMSTLFKDEKASCLMHGDSWGMFTMESFGMVSEVVYLNMYTISYGCRV